MAAKRRPVKKDQKRKTASRAESTKLATPTAGPASARLAAATLPPSMAGRIGQAAVERWAAQANIVANPSVHDDRGWDVFLQLPASDADHAVGPLDRSPPEVSCMIQVKTTSSTDRHEPIALSNWKRMITDPMPWFVLAIHLDASNEPDASYLVHVDSDWCSRVLRRLRKLGTKAHGQLHKHTINVTWADIDKFAILHGSELLRRIRVAVVPDQHAYVTNKLQWYRTLGYRDTARKVRVTYRAETESEFWTHMADIGVGLRKNFPGEWRAKVVDVRFGIEGILQEFDRSSGEMEYGAPNIGVATIEVGSSARQMVSQFRCDAYRAGAVFPFIPIQFDKVRLVSEYMTCLTYPVLRDDVRGFGTEFSFVLPQDAPISLGNLRNIVNLILILSEGNKHPISMRVTNDQSSTEIHPGSALQVEDLDLEGLRALDNFVAVCDQFALPDETPIMMAEAVAQKQEAQFMVAALTKVTGVLQAPYREAVPEGRLFGATTECALHVGNMMLACFVGMHGVVTGNDIFEGLGSRVTVAHGEVFCEKVIIDDNNRNTIDLRMVREVVLDHLRGLGCAAISLSSDESTRKANSSAAEPAAAPDGAPSLASLLRHEVAT